MRQPRGRVYASAPLAATLLLAIGLSACGSSQGPSNNPNPNSGYMLLPQGGTSPSPSPTPQADASPPPPQAEAAPAPPPPPAYPKAPLTFALTPVMGITGTVTVVVTSASTFTVTTNASGMAPGSVHAVHLHFGNCPSAGVHIVALSNLTAGPSGSGSSTTTVRMAYRGDGRFLIVYAGPNPGPLAACAQLSG